MAHLRYLDLRSNRIEDPAPLAGAPSLERLFLQGNGLRDITNLRPLLKLEVLTLDDNQIADLGPALDFPKLKTISAQRNPLRCETLQVHAPTLKARDISVRVGTTCIASVAPASAAPSGTLTLTVQGQGFESTASLALRDAQGNYHDASATTVKSADTIEASIALEGLPPGPCDLFVYNRPDRTNHWGGALGVFNITP
jgi:hypothetical protein